MIAPTDGGLVDPGSSLSSTCTLMTTSHTSRIASSALPRISNQGRSLSTGGILLPYRRLHPHVHLLTRLRLSVSEHEDVLRATSSCALSAPPSTRSARKHAPTVALVTDLRHAAPSSSSLPRRRLPHHHRHLQDRLPLFWVQSPIGVQPDALVFGKAFDIVEFQAGGLSQDYPRFHP